MTAPRSIHAQLILALNTGDVHQLEQVLAVFEGVPLLKPLTACVRPGAHQPYDRAKLLASLAAMPADEAVGEVRGGEKTAFHGWWYQAGNPLSALHVEPTRNLEASEAREFLAGISALAERLPVEFGTIDIRSDGQDRGTFLRPTSRSHHLAEYCATGPAAFFSRTFAGLRVATMAGAESCAAGRRVLAAVAGPSRRLENGVTEMDLLPEVWSAEPAAMKAAQAEAHARLLPTGLLAVPVTKYRFAPGPRWVRPGEVRPAIGPRAGV